MNLCKYQIYFNLVDYGKMLDFLIAYFSYFTPEKLKRQPLKSEYFDRHLTISSVMQDNVLMLQEKTDKEPYK